MTKHRIAVAFGVLACALGAAAAVRASIPDGAGVIHGCYTKSAAPGSQPGALRVIDTALGQTCQVSEGAVSWSQTGPPGPQGPQGPQGERGPTGPKGDPGANAYFAGTGLGLTGGNTFNVLGSYQLPQGCSNGQSPFLLGTPLTHPWSCFTAANANESCSSGKFQNGVDSSGDITCGAPAAGATGPDVWYARYFYSDTPQNADTTLATLSLPAGSFLLEATGTGEDDGAGNGNVEMSCHFDAGWSNYEERLAADGEGIHTDVPFHLLDVVSLAAPTDVNLICHDTGGSDHVQDGTMTALAVGAVH